LIEDAGEALEPVEAAEPLSPVYASKTAVRRSRSTLDWIVVFLSLSIALIALLVAIVQVAAFAATDQVPLQLLQWSALMLGLAGLAVVPFCLVGIWAWKGQARLWPTLLLMVPWLIVGIIWIAVSDYDWMIGAVPAIGAIIAILRAVFAHQNHLHSST